MQRQARGGKIVYTVDCVHCQPIQFGDATTTSKSSAPSGATDGTEEDDLALARGAAAPESTAPLSSQCAHLLLTSDKNKLLVITRDQLFVTYEPEDLNQTKLLVGHNDDIIDVKLFRPAGDRPSKGDDAPKDSWKPTKVAVVSNTDHLRVFDLATFDTTVYTGHSDMVLSVAVSPDGQFLATGAKDNTIRVWSTQHNTCVAVGEGHTDSVGTVAWPVRAGAFTAGLTPWLVSGSKDRTLKNWNLQPLLKASNAAATSGEDAADAGVSTLSLRTKCAVMAHDKEINAVAVAPNNAMVASASQDKTVKVWNAADLTLRGVMRGHKRGVWSVEFSPVDKILASASGDRTIRLWSVVDCSCIKTLEGHGASVLSVQFFNSGMQLLSSGADGLVKIWSIRDEECLNTLDGHTEKVWSIDAVGMRHDGPDGRPVLEGVMVSGGGDSVLNVWTDVTAEEEASALKEQQAAELKQQSLFNSMAQRNYRKAIALTLELEQPERLRLILGELLEVGPTKPGATDFFTDMLRVRREMAEEQSGADVVGDYGSSAGTSGGAVLGRRKLNEIVRRMPVSHLTQLLKYIREWNSQSRNFTLAQEMLAIIFAQVPQEKLFSCKGIREFLNALAPYTERHVEVRSG